MTSTFVRDKLPKNCENNPVIISKLFFKYAVFVTGFYRASVQLAVRSPELAIVEMSVRPPVRLLHAGTVSKRGMFLYQ